MSHLEIYIWHIDVYIVLPFHFNCFLYIVSKQVVQCRLSPAIGTVFLRQSVAGNEQAAKLAVGDIAHMGLLPDT